MCNTRPLQTSAARPTNHTDEKEKQPTHRATPSNRLYNLRHDNRSQRKHTTSKQTQLLSRRLNLFDCVLCTGLGTSRAATERTHGAAFPPLKTGPLCVHKSTNSSFARGARLAGQGCAGVLRKVMGRLPVERVNRKQRDSNEPVLLPPACAREEGGCGLGRTGDLVPPPPIPPFCVLPAQMCTEISSAGG